MLKFLSVRSTTRAYCLWWICCFAPLASVAHAQTLQFSAIDDATVRVFAIGEIGITPVRGNSGTAYQLATPHAGHGTGVIVHRDGLVLTAEHVIHDARRVAVKLSGSDEALPATVLYANAEKDFAFLAIGGTHEHVIAIGEVSPALVVRQRVHAIGYPIDADRSRPQSSQGIVAGMSNDGRLQLDIAINPGNSGGPLITESDELIGIIVTGGDVRRGVQGIAFAVPIDTIRPEHARLIADANALPQARARLSASTQSELATTRVMTRLVQVSLHGMLQEVHRQLSEGTGGVLRAEIDAALSGSGRDNVDVITIAAAYVWNAAIWMKEKRLGDPNVELERARQLAQRAAQLDPQLRTRSKFIDQVLSNIVPWGLRTPDLTPASDRQVTSNAGLPSFTLALAGVLQGPYFGEGGGVGAELDAHFANLLHIHGSFHFGGGANSKAIYFFDAYAGVELRWKHRTSKWFWRNFVDQMTWRNDGESEVDVGKSIVIEAGVMAGTLTFGRCVTLCRSDFEYDREYSSFQRLTGQLGFGLRYFSGVDAERSSGSYVRTYFQVFAHMFAFPFGSPTDAGAIFSIDRDFQWTEAEDLVVNKRTKLGGELGFAGSGSFGFGTISGGWLPSPGNGMLRIGWGYMFSL